MDLIFPIVNGYRRTFSGFQTVTREPQTQISCFLVRIALFWWSKQLKKRSHDLAPPRNLYIFFWSKGIFWWTGQGDQHISTCMLNLPFFILFHENWAYILGISKKNHQFSLFFANNIWSGTLDPIPYENTSPKISTLDPGPYLWF